MNPLQHVAIIMDGNGRWAQNKNRPRSFGHIKGARVAKKIITHANNLGLKYLTLYAFSTENWLRPQDEVSLLMRLLERYLLKETDNLVKENIRFSIIGNLAKLPLSVQKQVASSIQKTSVCTGLHVCFALSYGSRQEITSALKTIAAKVQSGQMNLSDINESLVEKYLMTAGMPDPDLLIRTSGESRISNFLLWQASYSELYFSPILWPDFTIHDLDLAFANYSTRERRFGSVSKKLTPTPNKSHSFAVETSTSVDAQSLS